MACTVPRAPRVISRKVSRAGGAVPAAGSHGSNAFGLADMAGSLAEMTADCVVGSLAHAPTGGSAAGKAGDCSRRIVKDASWREPAVMARVTARRAIGLDQRSDGVGLRVVREMERDVANHAETGEKGQRKR